MSMLIAGMELTVGQAVAVCRWYAEAHPATLTYYDFGGTDSDPHPHDTIDLSDAGRLVVINANLKADDVPHMIKTAETAPWERVRHDDDLLSGSWEELLDRAEALYNHFRHPPKGGGLGPTRTHKLLHLKRPNVFPIVDSVVRNVYREAARRDGGKRGAVYWPLLAREINGNADGYRSLLSALRGERVGRLTVPRLHDILVWSLHGRRSEEVHKEIERAQ